MYRSLIILAMSIAVLLVPSSVLAASHQLTVVYAAELPLIKNEPHGSYAQLATLLEQTRETDSTTTFLFGGGSLAPSMLSSFDRGAHIIDILNTLEPDAMAVAKREFSYYEDEFSLRAYEAAFPMVLSNAIDPLTGANIDGAVRRIIIEKPGIKIGVIALIHDSVIEEYLLQRLQITAPRNAVREQIALLNAEGADVIVLMISDKHDFVHELLEQGSVDVVLRTDPHHTLSSDNQHSSEHPGYVFITSPGTSAVVTLSWQDSDTGKQIAVDTIPLNQLQHDKLVDAQINAYDDRISALLGEEIATLATSMNTQRYDVRTSENGFGNLVSDALRSASHTDVALINGGAIRGERTYSPGYVLTREDISTELPFRSRITVLRLAGRHIKAALENGLSQVEQVAGRFPHVSGISMNIDLNAPVGERIKHIMVNGQPLEEARIYSMATSDFLAGGGDGYDALTLGTEVPFSQQVTPLIADIVISVLRRQQTISAKKSDRIDYMPSIGRND